MYIITKTKHFSYMVTKLRNLKKNAFVVSITGLL